MDLRDHPQPLPLPPVPHSPRLLLVPQAQRDGTVMPLPVGAMAPRQLFETLQQVAQEGLNQRLQQAAADGPMNITISSTMNLSVGRMQDVINSPGPDVSIVEIVSDDGDQSLTAMLEEVIDDQTLTPPCDITGHIMEVEIDKVGSTSQPAVCSTLPADPLRTIQPAVCSTVPQQAVFSIVSE
jgi:hypothetical protein